ncbi:hypothetical protein QBC38DRAFT_446241 [Podospora fimiseda]|uniref:Uncharacterized protein n=1 Tax=Podospora fimiseda TaxID=252190 RepID=A0AAN7GQN4_9PEZI|nr:hypothetical protein QBC38DRAFT_446241 [Podospora fimiseda]
MGASATDPGPGSVGRTVTGIDANFLLLLLIFLRQVTGHLVSEDVGRKMVVLWRGSLIQLRKCLGVSCHPVGALGVLDQEESIDGTCVREDHPDVMERSDGIYNVTGGLFQRLGSRKPTPLRHSTT